MRLKKVRGRPSQDKVMKPYTLDRKIAEFLDSLPDGDRSRFVNNILVQEVALEKLSGKYYIYFLMCPDGSVFYIGKGQGNRINEHEQEARRGVQSHKCNVIRKTWDEYGQIIKQKIAFFDDEEAAYQLEILLIAFWGRENLTNQRDGGEGGSVGGGEEQERYTIRFPLDLLDKLKCYAWEDNQSINSEIVEMLQAFSNQRELSEGLRKHDDAQTDSFVERFDTKEARGTG